jgi:single-stranded-DNA-specific exonuclease
LNNIELAAQTLLEHLNSESRIFVQVDSDCDGYTSSALLLNWIYMYNRELYRNVVFRIHLGKEHGLSSSIIDEHIQSKFDLVIIPDAGSGQTEIHRKLYESGISCIILDHHEANVDSDSATIVNPQLDDYPNKQLSGVGVVYKFCKVLDNLANTDFADSMLDLVALGMVADMMDIRSLETKRLIDKGVSNIRNAFLSALVERQAFSMQSMITPTTIGFYIAPLINAVVRAGTDEEKDIVFRCFLEENRSLKVSSKKRGNKDPEAKELLLEQACRIVNNVKSRQSKIRDEGTQEIEDIIVNNNLDSNKIILVIVEKTIDKNLSGLIANKLISKYKKPVMLLRRTRDGMLEGSCRGYEKSELVDFKTFLNDSGIVEYAEGHANAFGVGIKEDRVDSLVQYANEKLADIDFSDQFMLDYVYSPLAISAIEVLDIAGMKHLWGKGLDEPLFLLEQIKIKNEDIVLLSPDKSPTLKFKYRDITFIKFGSSKEEVEDLKSTACVVLDLIGKFSVNEWNGNIEAQIIVQDYHILERIKYYF